MKVLIVNGSPKGALGWTKKTTDILWQALARHGVSDCEEIFLAALQQPHCDGCLSCLKQGSDTCPALDKVVPIEKSIRQADVIIFATPVHSFHISAMMKTMVDLFVHEIHRPSFFGKKAVVVAVANGGGQRDVLKYLRNILRQWGMDVVDRLGVSSAQLSKASYSAKVEAAAEVMAQRLIAAVNAKQEPVPTLGDMIRFHVMRTVVDVTRDQAPLDFAYWSARGWMEANYFNHAPVNPIKNALAKGVGAMVRRSIRSGKLAPIH